MKHRPTPQITLPRCVAAYCIAQLLFGLGLALIGGCKGIELPAGAQAQASSVGIELAPQGPIGPHLTFGSKAVTITTAQPDNAPNLNRLAVEAPGINLRSTVATGPVGEQVKQAGGLSAIEAFSQENSPAQPRADPSGPPASSIGQPEP